MEIGAGDDRWRRVQPDRRARPDVPRPDTQDLRQATINGAAHYLLYAALWWCFDRKVTGASNELGDLGTWAMEDVQDRDQYVQVGALLL